jgi:hypothetical protein
LIDEDPRGAVSGCVAIAQFPAGANVMSPYHASIDAPVLSVSDITP